LSDNESKKQIPLRISPALWNDLTVWANDEFRSLNGQIEYLLTECVKARRKGPSRAASGAVATAPAPPGVPVFLDSDA